MKKIKLMAEYGCYPIWDITTDIPKNISTEDLEISKELKKKIKDWANKYEDTLDKEYPPDSGFKSIFELNKFEQDAKEIIQNLEIELKNKTTVLYEKTAELVSSNMYD